MSAYGLENVFFIYGAADVVFVLFRFLLPRPSDLLIPDLKHFGYANQKACVHIFTAFRHTFNSAFSALLKTKDTLL